MNKPEGGNPYRVKSTNTMHSDRIRHFATIEAAREHRDRYIAEDLDGELGRSACIEREADGGRWDRVAGEERPLS